jgi:hypothetical protein
MSEWVTELNGISVALVMAVVNSGLALLLAFGLNMTDTQQGSVQAFVNALLVMVAAVAHSNAKRTKTVIPAPPLDESRKTEGSGPPPPAA